MNWDFFNKYFHKALYIPTFGLNYFRNQNIKIYYCRFFVFCSSTFNANPDNSKRNFKFIISP
jgi:hypothetical protein